MRKYYATDLFANRFLLITVAYYDGPSYLAIDLENGARTAVPLDNYTINGEDVFFSSGDDYTGMSGVVIIDGNGKAGYVAEDSVFKVVFLSKTRIRLLMNVSFYRNRFYMEREIEKFQTGWSIAVPLRRYWGKV